MKDAGTNRNQPQRNGAGKPLAGVRVADFTWVWAGPACTKFLATMGAEVIRIESQSRVDTARNTASLFSTLNYNKKSCTINLQSATGIRLAKQLIAKSDIVTENFLPGAMEKLGLGYEDLRKVRPDLIMLSSSAMGRNGPLSHYSAYGDIIFSYAGHAYLTNYRDKTPRSLAGYWGDLTTGMTSAFGILAALHNRNRTGEGLYMDLSMVEGTLALLPEPMLDYFANHRVAEPIGNEDEIAAPHGCYPCVGKDEWIAIAVFSDEEWRALCDAMGRGDMPEEDRFSNQSKRWENRSELDGIMAAWTRQHHAEELFHMLQRAGVSAGPSYGVDGLLRDRNLKERGFFVEIPSPAFGDQLVTRLPWKLDGPISETYGAAPAMGQDNNYVFQELLGLSPEEQKELENSKVIY